MSWHVMSENRTLCKVPAHLPERSGLGGDLELPVGWKSFLNVDT